MVHESLPDEAYRQWRSLHRAPLLNDFDIGNRPITKFLMRTLGLSGDFQEDIAFALQNPNLPLGQALRTLTFSEDDLWQFQREILCENYIIPLRAFLLKMYTHVKHEHLTIRGGRCALARYVHPLMLLTCAQLKQLTRFQLIFLLYAQNGEAVARHPSFVANLPSEIQAIFRAIQL